MILETYQDEAWSLQRSFKYEFRVKLIYEFIQFSESKENKKNERKKDKLKICILAQYSGGISQMYYSFQYPKDGGWKVKREKIFTFIDKQ